MVFPSWQRLWLTFQRYPHWVLLSSLTLGGISALGAWLWLPPSADTLFYAVGQLAWGEAKSSKTEILKRRLLTPAILEAGAHQLQLSPEESQKIAHQWLTLTLPPQKNLTPSAFKSQLVTLQLGHPQSSERAQEILHGLMEMMVENQQSLQTARRPQQVLALSQRLAQAQKDLRLAENRLHEFLARPGNDALSFDQASLNREILQSQNQQQRLRTQLQRSLEKSMTPALKAQQRQWQARLQGAIHREQDLRARLGRLPERELARLRLSQGVEFQRLVYQNLLTALAQSQLGEAKALVQIVLPATPKPLPTTPFSLPRWTMVSLAGLAGAMGAMGVSLIILGWFTTRRLTPEKLRQALTKENIPLVTCLPLLPHAPKTKGMALLTADLEPVYFAFYNHLLQQLNSRSTLSAQVVLVTSVGEREGKTTTAYNLAIASARANRRTLLIEADLKKTSPAQCLNVELPQPHSRRVLNFCADPQDAIYLVPEITNLFILPSVGPVRPTESLLVIQKIQSLLAMTRCRFDLVVIDAPSLTQGKYSRDLELCSDSLLLVTRAGYTSIPLLIEVFDKTKRPDLTLWGAVINGVDDLLALALNNLREELSSPL